MRIIAERRGHARRNDIIGFFVRVGMAPRRRYAPTGWRLCPPYSAAISVRSLPRLQPNSGLPEFGHH